MSARARARLPSVKHFLSESSVVHDDHAWLQRGVQFDGRMWQGDTPSWLRKQRKVVERDGTMLAWQCRCPALAASEDQRSRVKRIEWIRYYTTKEIADDNLRTAWKYVRDATCAFVLWGRSAPFMKRRIGDADDILAKRGVTWTYDQRVHPIEGRAYGIRIVLHFGVDHELG